MNLIRNERLKLLATALNNVSVATFATALIAPAAQFLYGSNALAGSHFWLLNGACWFFGGFGLHLAAHLVLGRLIP